MTIDEALEVLRKYYGCRTTTGCASLCDLCSRCEYDVDADTVTEALKTVLDNLPTQMSGTSDAVSRRMVLDALHEYMDDTDYTVGHLHDVICNLPSAQPEIIHCKDCKHYYYADNRIPQEQRFSCDLDGDRWGPDDSCSYAEKRTDE